MIALESQRCVQCNRVKALEAFPPDERNRTGRASVCTACFAWIDRRRANNPPPCRNPRRFDGCIGVARYRRTGLCEPCRQLDYRARRAVR